MFKKQNIQKTMSKFFLISLLLPASNYLLARGLKDVRGSVPQTVKNLADQIRDRSYYQVVGAHFPKGILFIGKPGVGKTLLARQLAQEVGGDFWVYAAPEFENVWVGEGQRLIRNIFSSAKARATATKPVIVFIDEIDSLGSRSDRGSYTSSLINQLLTCMDGFAQNSNIIVIGATNYPDRLDSAMKRSGRFDIVIEIPEPNKDARKDIFKFYTEKHPHDMSVDEVFFDGVASLTEGFVGADLENLVNQAAINAAQSRSTKLSRGHFKGPYFDLLEKISLENASEAQKVKNSTMLSYKTQLGEGTGFTVIEPQSKRRSILADNYSLAEFLFGQGYALGAGSSSDKPEWMQERRNHYMHRVAEQKMAVSEVANVVGEQVSRQQEDQLVMMEECQQQQKKSTLWQSAAFIGVGITLGYLLDRMELNDYKRDLFLASRGYESLSPFWFGGNRWKIVGGLVGVGAAFLRGAR